MANFIRRVWTVYSFESTNNLRELLLRVGRSAIRGGRWPTTLGPAHSWETSTSGDGLCLDLRVVGRKAMETRCLRRRKQMCMGDMWVDVEVPGFVAKLSEATKSNAQGAHSIQYDSKAWITAGCLPCRRESSVNRDIGENSDEHDATNGELFTGKGSGCKYTQHRALSTRSRSCYLQYLIRHHPANTK